MMWLLEDLLWESFEKGSVKYSDWRCFCALRASALVSLRGVS